MWWLPSTGTGNYWWAVECDIRGQEIVLTVVPGEPLGSDRFPAFWAVPPGGVYTFFDYGSRFLVHAVFVAVHQPCVSENLQPGINDTTIMGLLWFRAANRRPPWVVCEMLSRLAIRVTILGTETDIEAENVDVLRRATLRFLEESAALVPVPDRRADTGQVLTLSGPGQCRG